MTERETKVCEHCGSVFMRLPRCSPSTFRSRRYCGDPCARKARFKPRDYQHPPCERCGKPVVQRQDEHNGRYRERRMCSLDCVRVSAIDNASASHTRRAEERRSWPEITGSRLRGNVFGAYDRDPGDGGPLAILPPPTTPLGREATS